MRSLIRRLWIALTYWPVKCEMCSGTGLCTGTQAGLPPSEPHSCCGDCERVEVSTDAVPPGFHLISGIPYALIGDGRMWRRPWSKTQIRKPK